MFYIFIKNATRHSIIDMAVPSAMYAVYHAKRQGKAGHSIEFFKQVCTHIKQTMSPTNALQSLVQIFCALGADDFAYPNGEIPGDDDAKMFISKAMMFRATNANSEARNFESSTSDPQINATDGAITEEGFMSCERCQSKRINWTSSHCRSMDEGMTVFAECSQCFKRWKIYS